MQLVQQHVINKNHEHYKEIDHLAFLSKNLYNAANYLIRQSFIKKGEYLGYRHIQKVFQSENQFDYRALPPKISQQILMILDKNWKSFFEAQKEYCKHPEKFLGRPKLPKYKHKTNGRNILVYTRQAISKPALVKNSVICLSQTNIKIPTDVEYKSLAQVRIVPKINHYVVEVVYNQLIFDIRLDRTKIAGIDIGLNNLATLVSNIKGFKPIVLNGRPLKSINQYFNKKKAKLQSLLGNKTSNRIKKLCSKRGFKVDDYLHKASRKIIKLLIENEIGTLVIGKNDNWKQDINIGKANNQNFVQIPHTKFINQLKYKAELINIKVIITEESYTSKASFLDSDPIPTYKKGIKHTFSGKRIQRGLYRSNSKRLINADVNGAYNIIKKAIPNTFVNGIEGVLAHPVRLNLQIN